MIRFKKIESGHYRAYIGESWNPRYSIGTPQYRADLRRVKDGWLVHERRGDVKGESRCKYDLLEQAKKYVQGSALRMGAL
jgi:hypothetical protein